MATDFLKFKKNVQVKWKKVNATIKKVERSDWWKQYVRIFHKKIYIQKMQRRQTSSNSILAVNAKTIEANWSSTCRPANSPGIQPSFQFRSWPVGTFRGKDRRKKAAFVLRKCYYLWLPSLKELSRKSSYFKRRCSVTVKYMHDNSFLVQT